MTNDDLSIPGLVHATGTRSVTVGGMGHTMRLSLNTSTQAQPNRTGPNATNIADPLAGTDGTLQPTDTGHSGYYSILMKVGNITNLQAAGGVLLGFNNLIGGQTLNPTTVCAGLTIRPKAGGAAGEFELGIVKNGSQNFGSCHLGHDELVHHQFHNLRRRKVSDGRPVASRPAVRSGRCRLVVDQSSTQYVRRDLTRPAP